MGNKITAMPKYIRDFNIENRAAKEINLDRIKQSPRHLYFSFLFSISSSI